MFSNIFQTCKNVYFRGKYKESFKNHLRLKSLRLLGITRLKKNYVILIKKNGVAVSTLRRNYTSGDISPVKSPVYKR